MSYWSSWPNICHWSLLSFWTGKRWKGSSAWNLSILVPQQKTPYEGSWWNFLWFHYFWIFAIQLLKKHYPFHSTESYHNLATRNNQLGELLSGHIHCQPMLSIQTCTVKKIYISFEHLWLENIWVKCLCKFLCCSEKSPYGVWCLQKSHM